MAEQLRKLAEALRMNAQSQEKRKQVKCAQAAQAALGLELLRTKIGV